MKRRSITLATTAGLALAGAALLATAGSVGAGQSALPAGNLVQNPGAEGNFGGAFTTARVQPVRWQAEPADVRPRVHPVQVVRYNATDKRLQSRATSAAIGGGANFFAGALPDVPPEFARSFQMINVAGAAPEIDSGNVRACVSAWMGGSEARDAVAWLTVEYLGEDGAALGQTRIGGVTKGHRRHQTTLLRRAAQANMPRNTRQLRVALSMHRMGPDGGSGYSETAHVDNISVALTRGACEPVLAVRCQAGALVATVTPSAIARTQRVRYQVRGAKGSKVATATRAPFQARVPMTGLTGALRVTATVTQAGSGNVVLEARSRRC